MYFFGLSKEHVLSQTHVVSYKETSKQSPISTVTLFGRQVFPLKDSTKLLMRGDIDLEELPTTNHDGSVSYEHSDRTTTMELGLLDLNRTPPADECVSEPHYSFLQDLNCPYIEETEDSCEKSGVDDGPTPFCSPKCHEKECTTSPASYTSCCTTENKLRRGSSPRATDPSCRTRLEFPVLPENECCTEEEKFSEVMQMAAESLVHISACSYQNQDQDIQDKPEMVNVEPRCCSCDSYELHTLGITETNTEEDLCVSSSMAIDELNNVTRDTNKETGLKLRRGRRMKNF